MSTYVEVREKPYDESRTVFSQPNVIGHVLALVVKGEDGSITLERDIAVNADSAEDNQLAEATVKAIEAKLNEAFPDPNKQEQPKIWVPA